jgi:hypothetical protein
MTTNRKTRKTTKTTKTDIYDTAMTSMLKSRGRRGMPKVQTLGWKRLAEIYHSAKPGTKVRRLINAEARRCGYDPKIILSLNA